MTSTYDNSVREQDVRELTTKLQELLQDTEPLVGLASLGVAVSVMILQADTTKRGRFKLLSQFMALQRGIIHLTEAVP